MQIHKMRATFGKLEQAELCLQPGLNVIYAPNESGKSTWTAFLRNMLYGLSTRDRGELADKNRYAPWSGSLMLGSMELESGGEAYTLVRQTRRVNAPMGEFSCTFTGTAEPVPGITAQNAGEMLLGVSRDVFERSAFIAQSSLAVDQSAELERRIASLITTGDEDTSYTETCERLKKQLNRRRHNKTGQIPALEREIDRLEDALTELEALQSQHQATAEQVALCTRQLAQLQRQKAQWAQLEQQRQWTQFRSLEQDTAAAQTRLDTLTALSAPLPDEAALARLEGAYEALLAADRQLGQAQEERQDAIRRRESAVLAWRSHPLYPAEEAALQQRCEAPLPALSPALPFSLCASLSGAALIAAVVLLLLSMPIPAAIAAGSFLLTGAAALVLLRKRRKTAAARKVAEQQRETLHQQTEVYLPLLRRAAEERANADACEKVAESLVPRRQALADELLDSLHAYRPETGEPDVPGTLAELRRQRRSVEEAGKACQTLAMQRDLMREHLPPKPSGEPCPTPPISLQQIEAALPQTAANLQTAQSRLDTLAGQIRSMGDADDLVTRRDQMVEELARLQAEYDAISLAMETLEHANTTLQNRFSPALGQRTAEIFAGITGGKYEKVLLSRDFSLAAEPAGDAAMRSVQVLSRGAADQLYLAVRLAICDLVLPPEYSAPLVLDDALVTFDDARAQSALDYLAQEGSRRQILLFTCQTREQTYLQGRPNVTCLTL